MALLQSIHLEHLPTSHVLHIALFHSVSNAAFLHQQLLDGNAEFEYALIDASVVVSRVHALAAAFRAANDSIEGRLRSRNVHSEIVFALSPNNNISESFRRFGITPTTTSLLVIKVSTPDKPVTASAVQDHLGAAVKGTQVAFEDAVFNEMTNWVNLRKYYKLGVSDRPKVVAMASGSGSDIQEEEKKELEAQILGAMALRGTS